MSYTLRSYNERQKVGEGNVGLTFNRDSRESSLQPNRDTLRGGIVLTV